MFKADLNSITSKHMRETLEAEFNVGSLKEYKTYIDTQMITIMGQMESASNIFEYLYLGTEWNACNKEELEKNNVMYIVNVTKEIINAFPDKIKYHTIQVWDTPSDDLMPHWEASYRFIRQGTPCSPWNYVLTLVLLSFPGTPCSLALRAHAGIPCSRWYSILLGT